MVKTSNIKKKELREYITGDAFVLPVLVFIFLFIIWPVIQSLVLAFFRWDGVGPWRYVGLKNFVKMFTKEPLFYQSLKNSVIFAVVTTFGEMAIGFTAAVLIDLGIRCWKVYRFIFYLPVLLSQVAVSLLWTKIYAEDGLVNTLLGVLHLENLQNVWLGDPRFALWAVCLVSMWQFGGWHMIFFLAGMQGIDPQIYESAKIDGASTLRRVFSITIPMLKNVFFIITILSLIMGFKAFDMIYVMTSGGPAMATEILGTLLYTQAFDVQRYGYASVIAVVMVIIAMLFSMFYIRLSGYQKEAVE